MSQADEVPERVDKIGLSWFLEKSSFDPVRHAFAVTRSVEMDGTGFGSLDTWFPYCWKTGELFASAEGARNISHKRLVYGDVALARRAFSTCVVSFDVDQPLSIDQARAKISTSNGTLGLASDAEHNDLHDHELTSYRDDDDGND